MKKSVASVLSVAIALGGCATASKDVPTSYASPIQFSNYTCDQITAENARLQGRLSQLQGRLDTAAANDQAIAGIGIVLFWPALFALGGTKEQEAEYGRLKGEHDALRQAWIQKGCTINAASLLPGAASSTPLGAVPTQGPSPAAGTTLFVAGDKLVYKTREPVSGLDQGESSMTISSISNGEIGFDDGSLVISTQGAISKGNVTRNTILGVDVSRLQPGNRLQGKFRIVAARVQDVTVDLTVVGVETLELSGRRINAVRLDASGYTTREVMQGNVGSGAPFAGTLTLDSSTGIVISMKIKSQNPMYGTDLALIGVVNPTLAPVVTQSPLTTSMPATSVQSQAQSKEERLKELKRLYDAGLVNAEVYSAQQKSILGN